MTLEITTNQSSIDKYFKKQINNAVQKFKISSDELFLNDTNTNWADDMEKFKLVLNSCIMFLIGYLAVVNRINSYKFFGKVKQNVSFNFIGSLSYNPKHNTVNIISFNEGYDSYFRNVAVELAKEFNVTFAQCKYEPKEPQGSIKCQYCGQNTKDVEHCTHCGGKPI
jgi:hypothetical protein